MRIKEKIKQFFNPAPNMDKLHREISDQRDRIYELTSDYMAQADWANQYASTVATLTGSLELLIWKKDAQHRYILANGEHCQFFFGIDSTPECLAYIKGKTDQDVIREHYIDQGVYNSFGKVCRTSDEHAATFFEPKHYLEAGVIDDKEVLLYLIKKPQFDNQGNFTGLVGLSWDFSNNSEFIINMLNGWVRTGQAEILMKEKDVFCYVVDPGANKCEVFKHICPKEYNSQPCNPAICTACPTHTEISF